jgi:hypothetical protein
LGQRGMTVPGSRFPWIAVAAAFFAFGAVGLLEASADAGSSAATWAPQRAQHRGHCLQRHHRGHQRRHSNRRERARRRGRCGGNRRRSSRHGWRRVIVPPQPPAPAAAPPVFAGLSEAVACTGGPGLRPPRYTLRWSPASDDRTPSAAIVYDIYQTTSPGTQDFETPTYTSPPGATSYTTPDLSAGVSYYFVVRARDQDGNRDPNLVERLGQDPCV